MVTFNKQRQKMLELSLYQLKRDLGVGPLDIYKFGGTNVDEDTGQRSIARTKVTVPLAIPLSTQSKRQVINTISSIGAAKDFVYGGYHDRDTKTFIVQKSELPFELGKDDWFIFDDKKYKVHTFKEWDVAALYVITGQHQKGDSFSQIFDKSSRDVLFLGESANAS